MTERQTDGKGTRKTERKTKDDETGDAAGRLTRSLPHPPLLRLSLTPYAHLVSTRVLVPRPLRVTRGT